MSMLEARRESPINLIVLAEDYNKFRRWCVKSGLAPFDCFYPANLESFDIELKKCGKFAIVIAVDGWSRNKAYDSAKFHLLLNNVHPKVIKALP